MTDPLLFIDTNIILDFYRVRNGSVRVEFLDQIEQNYRSIILTSQVEMEYKKHRQKVIIDSLKELKTDIGNSSIAPILNNSQPATMMNRKIKEYKEQYRLLKGRISAILNDPSKNDMVYQTMNRVFKKDWDFHQNRTDEERYRIRKLAFKRFGLGYPPRKKGDTSIGDAVNWEYIIDCANRVKKDVLIVSRDGDYGLSHDGQSFMNDWLSKEFKERVGRRQNIQLTTNLSDGLAAIHSPVSKATADAEIEMIESSSSSSSSAT
mgnify:CR=1 FL=1